MNKIYKTNDFGGTLIVRLMVGIVFLSEGIQKFLFPDAVGLSRFIKIGIPVSEFFAPFVGCVEIIGGVLLLLGLYTRLAAFPLIIIMVVAITTTKLPILIDKGFWKMAHEARTDYAMLLGSIYLVLFGGGKWSVDNKLQRKGGR